MECLCIYVVVSLCYATQKRGSVHFEKSSQLFTLTVVFSLQQSILGKRLLCAILHFVAHYLQS